MANKRSSRASMSSSLPKLPEESEMKDPFANNVNTMLGEAAVLEAIEDICSKAGNQIEKNELEKEGIPFAVGSLIRDLKRICRTSFLARESDHGENCVSGNFYNKFIENDAGSSGDGPEEQEDGEGEAKNRPPPAPVHLWRAEAEPVPAVIDTWARGAVPLKVKKSAYDEAMAGISRSSLADADGKSVRTTGSRFTSKTRRHLDRIHKSNSLTPHEENPKDEEVVLIEIREPGLGQTAAAAAATGDLGPPPVFGDPTTRDPLLMMGFEDDADGEDPFSQDAAKLEALKKAEAARLQRLQREEEELMARHERTAKELKGQRFHFEPDGRLVVVRPVKGDSLPPGSYQPPSRVQDYAPPPLSEELLSEAGSAYSSARGGGGGGGGRRVSGQVPASARSGFGGGGAQREGMSKGKGKGKGKGKERRGSSSVRHGSVQGAQRAERERRRRERRPSDYYTVSPGLQPSLLGTMELAAGVALDENGSAKAGPSLMDDPDHMSRREYRLRHEAEGPGTAAAPSQVNSAPGSPLDGRGSRNAMAAAAGGGGGGGAPPLGAGALVQRVSVGSAKVSPRGLDPGSVAGASAITDPTAFLAYEGRGGGGGGGGGVDDSHLDSPSLMPQSARTKDTLQTSSYAAAGGPLRVQLAEEDEDDPHLALIRSPAWGQNPGAGPPQPPVLPRRAAAGGARRTELYQKNPRERVRPEILRPTAEARRLAAPPLGQATGHGLRGGSGGGGGGWASRSGIDSQAGSPAPPAHGRKGGGGGGATSSGMFPPVSGASPAPGGGPPSLSRGASPRSQSTLGAAAGGSRSFVAGKRQNKIVTEKSGDYLRSLLFD